MHALGPPEKDAKTTGQDLIFSSYMQQKREKPTQCTNENNYRITNEIKTDFLYIFLWGSGGELRALKENSSSHQPLCPNPKCNTSRNT